MRGSPSPPRDPVPPDQRVTRSAGYAPRRRTPTRRSRPTAPAAPPLDPLDQLQGLRRGQRQQHQPAAGVDHLDPLTGRTGHQRHLQVVQVGDGLDRFHGHLRGLAPGRHALDATTAGVHLETPARASPSARGRHPGRYRARYRVSEDM